MSHNKHSRHTQATIAGWLQHTGLICDSFGYFFLKHANIGCNQVQALIKVQC